MAALDALAIPAFSDLSRTCTPDSSHDYPDSTTMENTLAHLCHYSRSVRLRRCGCAKVASRPTSPYPADHGHADLVSLRQSCRTEPRQENLICLNHLKQPQTPTLADLKLAVVNFHSGEYTRISVARDACYTSHNSIQWKLDQMSNLKAEIASLMPLDDQSEVVSVNLAKKIDIFRSMEAELAELEERHNADLKVFKAVTTKAQILAQLARLNPPASSPMLKISSPRNSGEVAQAASFSVLRSLPIVGGNTI